mgnify:CR=1 FL=1
MTQSNSAGARFRRALAEEQPLQIMGTINAYTAMMAEQVGYRAIYLSGGGVWDPSIRGLYAVPAKLEMGDVLSAVTLSLGLSFIVTIFPARRAARLNPVEALRYE